MHLELTVNDRSASKHWYGTPIVPSTSDPWRPTRYFPGGGRVRFVQDSICPTDGPCLTSKHSGSNDYPALIGAPTATRGPSTAQGRAEHPCYSRTVTPLRDCRFCPQQIPTQWGWSKHQSTNYLRRCKSQRKAMWRLHHWPAQHREVTSNIPSLSERFKLNSERGPRSRPSRRTYVYW